MAKPRKTPAITSRPATSLLHDPEVKDEAREPAAAQPAAAQLGPQTLIPGVEAEEPAPRAKFKWPRDAKCPRCGSDRTLRIGQHDDTQYRVCQVPICRKRFPVIGKPV